MTLSSMWHNSSRHLGWSFATGRMTSHFLSRGIRGSRHSARRRSAKPATTPPQRPALLRRPENGRAQRNTLLAPVHVPHPQNGVLTEDHPAARLLSNSAIVVQRQLEMMNVMLGFEQANKYVIMDPEGNHIGYMAERDSGLRNMMTRQWFRTHRSFITHVFDKNELEVLRFHRPFSWISSRIRVYDPWPPTYARNDARDLIFEQIDASPLQTARSSPRISQLAMSEMQVIGEAQQQWAPLRRKYNLFAVKEPASPRDQLLTENLGGDLSLPVENYSQFAMVDEPFLSWDFSLQSADSRLIGSVNRNFSGFAREIFTDTGVYALRMDAAGLAEEPRHLISRSGESSPSACNTPSAGMTLDQRAVMLATAVSIDFDYFSRHGGAGGMGFFPIWFPGAGGTAAEGGAVAEAEAGAGQVVEQAGKAAGGAAGVGTSDAATAGAAMAGYEAMRRSGSPPNESSPTSEAIPASKEAPFPPGNQPGQYEDIWGDPDPWKNGRDDGGSSTPSDGSAGEDGGGGGWEDWL